MTTLPPGTPRQSDCVGGVDDDYANLSNSIGTCGAELTIDDMQKAMAEIAATCRANHEEAQAKADEEYLRTRMGPPPVFTSPRSEIAKDGTVTMRTTHFPPIYRAGAMGWAEGAGKTRSGFAFTFGVDLDGPIVSPNLRKLAKRAARRVRMARKKRRGYA